MTELHEDTKKALKLNLDNLVQETTLKASQLSLFKFVGINKSITMELFSQNIEEYLNFMVSSYITTNFSTGLKKTLTEFSELLIKLQGGQLLTNSDPCDLTFSLKNNTQYWLEIKSINDLNYSTISSIKEHKALAEKNERIYRLFIYDSNENLFDEEYKLNGNEFWELIAGFKNAETELFLIINGAANKLSLSSLIKETHTRLLNEWRMH